MPEDFTAKLLELGIIEESDIENEETEYGPPVGTYRLDLDSFVDLYFRIAQYSLPDLEWDDRDLLEEQIYDLNGAAYGLAYRG